MKKLIILMVCVSSMISCKKLSIEETHCDCGKVFHTPSTNGVGINLNCTGEKVYVPLKDWEDSNDIKVGDYYCK
jgi:hypothetical protein